MGSFALATSPEISSVLDSCHGFDIPRLLRLTDSATGIHTDPSPIRSANQSLGFRDGNTCMRNVNTVQYPEGIPEIWWNIHNCKRSQ